MLQPFVFRRRCVGEREFFIDNLLVRIHFIIVMIRWTGLAPWVFEFPFPGSLTSTFLCVWVARRNATPESWECNHQPLGKRIDQSQT